MMKQCSMRNFLMTTIIGASALLPTVHAFSVAAINVPQDQKQLLPTEGLHMIFQEREAQPDKQYEIGRKYLPRVKTTGLTTAEQFALGEFYFAAGMPDESKAMYEKFVDGGDMHARMARQRLMWMTMAAYQKYDGVEKNIYEYRAKFPAVKEDLYHLAGPVYGLADHYREQGNHEKVVKLVTDEIESLPANAAYYSFSLPATFFESFKQTGKEAAAIRMLEKARDVFSAALAERERINPESKGGTGPVTHRPGVLHRVEEGLRADYPPSMQVDPTIKRKSDQINSILATARKASSQR